MQPSNVEVCRIHVTTRCRSLDAFIASRAGLVDESSICVATPTPMRFLPGKKRGLVFHLVDGTVVLEGIGEVVEVWACGPSGQPGMKIRFIELTPDSRALLRTMLAAKRRRRPHRDTVPSPPPAMMSVPPPLPPPVPPRPRAPVARGSAPRVAIASVPPPLPPIPRASAARGSLPPPFPPAPRGSRRR